MAEFDTVRLQALLQRIRNGDESARDELIRVTINRLESLARRMLRGFPTVRSLHDTLDVLQNSLLRLLRAIEQVTPASTREFMCLAATQMRRELLDLARRHRRTPVREGDAPALGAEGAALAELAGQEPVGADDLGLWEAFHEAVERLPVEEREVMGLAFYHGWSQSEIAELFAIDERTVRRRWRAACLRLNDAVGGAVQFDGRDENAKNGS